MGYLAPVNPRTDEKLCRRCGTVKPLDAFGQRKQRGKVTPQPYCRACMVAYHSEWRATPDGAAKFADRNAASRARYPDRHRARVAVRAALQRGSLLRGVCELTDSSCVGLIDAHHDDYDKPLEVRWVCRKHHRVLDRARRVSSSLRRSESGQ